MAYTQQLPIQSYPASVSAPAANVAAVVSFLASPGTQHVITRIDFSYSGSGTLAGGNLTIYDGPGNAILSIDITAMGAGFLEFNVPMMGSNGNPMSVVLAAGSANVSGKISVGHEFFLTPVPPAILIPLMDFSKPLDSQYLALI